MHEDIKNSLIEGLYDRLREELNVMKIVSSDGKTLHGVAVFKPSDSTRKQASSIISITDTDVLTLQGPVANISDPDWKEKVVKHCEETLSTQR